GILTPVRRGVYLFSPLDAGPAGAGIDELLIPGLYFPDGNYYVGYASMFSYYGFTEQIFQTVHVLNTSFQRDREICGILFRFLKIPAARLYGIVTIKAGGSSAQVSSLERTLVDLVYFHKPVGGVDRAMEILKREVTGNKCDVARLIRLSARFPNATVRKRIGICLERAGIPEKSLAVLIKSVARTSISSFGNSRKGRIDKKWKVIVSDP
ncbi:MAG: type IV toxin-antitoxin system AbiEi family antitoxin, partial [Candidatus Wallbacteria bacterium]|nr:type IV toxin-antitoxin system AbiEi family antitoxin [Candidatus Wallbacteria bacterium]